MDQLQRWFHFAMYYLLCSMAIVVVSEQQLQPFVAVASDCQTRCGNITIPYPFGIGDGCYLHEWFEIRCINNSSNSTAPMLRINSSDLEVMDISTTYATVRINFPVVYAGCGSRDTNLIVNLEGTPFAFSQIHNRFTALGCNNLALMTQNKSIVGGCMSICDEHRGYSDPDPDSGGITCSGINCCQTTIPSNLKVFNATFKGVDNSMVAGQCKTAFLFDQNWFGSSANFSNLVLTVPVVLDWRMDHQTYLQFMGNRKNEWLSSTTCDPSNSSTLIKCSCRIGFQGNPYASVGCEDIDECCTPEANNCSRYQYTCFNTKGGYYCISSLDSDGQPHFDFFDLSMVICLGLLFLVTIVVWFWKSLKKRNKRKMREKYFKRNGGLLLKEQVSQGQMFMEKVTMFSAKELEKATDDYNASRLLGQGGQGSVYKGMLADGKLVAIKKCQIPDESKLRQFINEVAILSQINHRNVVKLLGCCLETEVPLLVFEFIPNGTLFHILHEENEEFALTWKMRMRIAVEVAGALDYLHSAAPVSIYHRDIKSTNILLDEKFKAKVSDFGTSRSITIDQTHLTTLVKGTFGYLDPEYFQSSKFTDKSDVYSFGVVLLELLTRQKPISSTRSEEERGLVSYFRELMEEEEGIFKIVDDQVMKEVNKEVILRFGKLAKRCLIFNGKERPTMKEVALELEGLIQSK